MGLRFRRSVRLFPGVRLNFSRSGVSTSVGVRGASMTFGPRGTYANVGLPGSGLSYRTRLDTPAVARPQPAPVSTWQPQNKVRTPIRATGVETIPGTEVEIKSADIGVLTSAGLDELKQLINEATLRHTELRSEFTRRKKTLDRAAGRLRWAESPIIRLFTAKSIPRLVDVANKASEELDVTEAQLDGCFVEIDFAFDDNTRSTYANLVRSFETLITAQRIWDITATAAVNRVVQRTTASNALTRKRVVFDFVNPEIVRSQYRAMRLGTVSGRDLQIFPGFWMMRDTSRDFALMEFAEVDCRFAQSNFIEEDAVPSDAEQVGSTWKRANKDGSRDRRFNDNYQIPVLLYGALTFSSPTGLAEVFQISSFAKAHDFAQALAAHKGALAKLSNAPTDALALPPPSDAGEVEEQQAELAFFAKPRKNLAIDWALLVVLVAGLGFGGIWTGNHWGQITAAAPPPAVATPAPVSVEPKPVVHAGHRRHHRNHRTTEATSAN